LFGAIADPNNHHVPGLGDLVSRNAFLKILSDSHRSARISFVGGPRLIRRFGGYLLNHAYVDELIECPEPGEATLRQWLRFFRHMRDRGFDLCIVDPASAVRAMHACLCGIPQRIGVAAHPSEIPFLSTPLQLRPATPGSFPDLLDVTDAFARALNAQLDTVELTPRFPYERVRSTHAPGIIVAVHAGGDKSWNRRWPLWKFQQLCERLCREAGVTVYLTGGPDDGPENEELLASVSSVHPSARIFKVSDGTLNEMAERLDEATLFIGNDSAPMHIAAALGKPLIVLCGPIDAGFWERMYAATVITRPTRCQRPSEFSGRRHRERQYSCLEHQCPYTFDARHPAYPKCLSDIDVDDVWSAAQRHLQKRRLASHP